MLLGAFLQNYSGHLAMLSSGKDRALCRNALISLAEYCRFRLEADRHWLRTPGEPSTEVVHDALGNAIMQLREIAPGEITQQPALTGRTAIEGEFLDSDIKFWITVVNNLDSQLEDPVHSVAPKLCRLRIQTRSGRAAETVEITLRKAAYFNSTVAASGDIELSGDSVRFESTDPLNNQIRSLADIYLPDIPDLEFRPDPGNQRAEKGTVWAYGDISIGEDSSQPKLDQAHLETGGDFIPQGRTAYFVPELAEQDVVTANPTPMELEPAKYLFTELEVEFLDTSGNLQSKTIHALQKFQPGWQGPQDDLLQEIHFLESALDDPDYIADLDTVTIPGEPEDPVALLGHSEPEFQLADGPEFVLPSEDGGQVPQVRLPANTEIVVRGDFGISTTDPLNLPILEFVDPFPDPENPKRGHLEVQRNLELASYIVNGGKLIAGNDIVLTPKDVEVNSSEEEDLAVYAGNDITIAPLFPRTQEGYLLDTNRKFLFRGLVYAQNDFHFYSSLRQGDQVVAYQRLLEIEGALVARNGKVQIQGEEDIVLRYNPDFLDDLLEKNFEDTKIQLEETAWRPL